MADAAFAPTTAPTATPTLRTFALAAIAERVGDGLGSSAEAQYLRQHLGSAGGVSDWRDRLVQYIASPAVADEPLLMLARELGLSPIEVLTTALCVAVEHDVVVGRVLSAVQAPLGGSRPTVALMTASLADARGDQVIASTQLTNGPAAEAGLLSVLGDEAPLPERAVAIPIHLASALAGTDAAVAGCSIDLDPAQQVELPASFDQHLARYAAGLLADPDAPLVVRAASRAEGRALAHALARAMQRRPLFVETDEVTGVGPWALVRRLLPVFCFDLAPGERKAIPTVPRYQGPVVALCGHDGMLDSVRGPALTWVVPVPDRDERVALWQRAIDDDELAQTLGRDHRHGIGRIFHLGRLARQEAALRGRATATREDVIAGSWTVEGGGLDSLAQPMRQRIPDEALVITPQLRDQLEWLVRRCRARDGLIDGLGVSLTARYQPGVRALFVGPSGTGKTLAAGWLATRLGLPLYRVDLAAVTSKYIGETEKNLAQLLARAEQSEVVLLFDEADSLFGKRTDVRDANDRFANAQTNYLLQRIEYFDGISILTSNSRSRFDEAFSRRLDTVVEFTVPGPDERRALWMSHVGGHHRLEGRDVNQLAALADLCGGEIRNAVLSAAVLAHAADRPIEYEDLVAGIGGEYRKSGRQMPMEIRRRG